MVTSSPEPAPDRPLQFSMRTLLGSVAVLCGLLALLNTVGTVWFVAIVWMLILVGAHVFANVCGTRRRLDAGRCVEDDNPGTWQKHLTSTSARGSRPQVTRFAPATRLRRKMGLGKVVVVTTAAGALLGCLVGVRYLLELGLPQIGYTGMLLGAFSFAVIGGLLGFLAGSFVSVSRGALHEAQQELPAVKRP